MTKLERVFEMLGVEPNEEFCIKQLSHSDSYRITKGLLLQYKSESDYWCTSTYELGYILSGLLDIVKPEKTKLDILHEQMAEQSFEFSLSIYLSTTQGDRHFLQENCETEEDMKFLAEKMKVESELRFLQKMMPDNKWEESNEHWTCYYTIDNKELVYMEVYDCITSEYYFPTRKACVDAIMTIGADRYKKYILGIKETSENDTPF